LLYELSLFVLTVTSRNIDPSSDRSASDIARPVIVPHAAKRAQTLASTCKGVGAFFLGLRDNRPDRFRRSREGVARGLQSHCCESVSVNSSIVIANHNICRSRADRLAPFSEYDLLWHGRGATKQHFGRTEPRPNAGAFCLVPCIKAPAAGKKQAKPGNVMQAKLLCSAPLSVKLPRRTR
jgi:hypothetical protein